MTADNATPLAQPRSRGLAGRLDRLSEGRFALAIGVPGLLLVALFVVPPVLAVIVMSFFRIEVLKDDFTPFIAFRNYAVRMAQDSEFIATLPRTFVLGVAATAVAIPLALGVALLINGQRRLAGIMGLLLILPWAVAPIADGLFWRQVFSPTAGLLGGLLNALGLPAVDIRQWSGSFVVILVAVVWRAVPLLGVLLLGALRTVSPDTERAARLDGASELQVFRYVTLPAIAPILVAASVLQIILTLQVFDIQFAVTGDAPAPGSILSSLSIYDTVIGSISLGYGAAQTVVLGLLIAGCLGVLWLFVRPHRATRAPDADPRPLRLRARPIAPPAALAGPITTDRLPEPSGSRTTSRRLWASGRSGTLRLLRWTGTVLVVLFLLGPIVWILIASTQKGANLGAFPPLLSTSLDLSAYSTLINDPRWRSSAVISITVTTAATAIALIVAVLTAYPMARYRLRSGPIILVLLAVTQLIPPIALALPILWLNLRAHLNDTVPGLVLVNAAFWTPILVWLVRGAFLSVPANLESAARMDGSSRLGAIFRITLPNAAPAIAAATAIVFVGIWNDFVFAAVLGGRNTSTLPRYLGQSASPSLNVLAATIVLTVAPCILLVILMRRRILRTF